MIYIKFTSPENDIDISKKKTYINSLCNDLGITLEKFTKTYCLIKVTPKFFTDESINNKQQRMLLSLISTMYTRHIIYGKMCKEFTVEYIEYVMFTILNDSSIFTTSYKKLSKSISLHRISNINDYNIEIMINDRRIGIISFRKFPYDNIQMIIKILNYYEYETIINSGELITKKRVYNEIIDALQYAFTFDNWKKSKFNVMK